MKWSAWSTSHLWKYSYIHYSVLLSVVSELTARFVLKKPLEPGVAEQQETLCVLASGFVACDCSEITFLTFLVHGLFRSHCKASAIFVMTQPEKATSRCTILFWPCGLKAKKGSTMYQKLFILPCAVSIGNPVCDVHIILLLLFFCAFLCIGSSLGNIQYHCRKWSPNTGILKIIYRCTYLDNNSF